MQIILKYFPYLSSDQIFRFGKLASLYRNWNTIVKVLPKKDIESLYEEHILHSLAIAKVVNFKPGSSILDVGTGGGFPGIPLAILFPLCQFTLLDSMQKRILVVQSVADTLNLKNVIAIQGKIEDVFERYDFVVSRAMAAFPNLVGMVRKNISSRSQNVRSNGIVYLKGGNFEDEIIDYKKDIEVSEIIRFFNEPCFRSKKVIYLPIDNYMFEMENRFPQKELPSNLFASQI